MAGSFVFWGGLVSIIRPQIAVACQVISIRDRESVTVSNHKEVISDSGNRVIVVVGNDDSVILTSVTDDLFYRFDMQRIYL